MLLGTKTNFFSLNVISNSEVLQCGGDFCGGYYSFCSNQFPNQSDFLCMVNHFLSVATGRHDARWSLESGFVFFPEGEATSGESVFPGLFPEQDVISVYCYLMLLI